MTRLRRVKPFEAQPLKPHFSSWTRGDRVLQQSSFVGRARKRKVLCLLCERICNDWLQDKNLGSSCYSASVHESAGDERPPPTSRIRLHRLTHFVPRAQTNVPAAVCRRSRGSGSGGAGGGLGESVSVTQARSNTRPHWWGAVLRGLQPEEPFRRLSHNSDLRFQTWRPLKEPQQTHWGPKDKMKPPSKEKPGDRDGPPTRSSSPSELPSTSSSPASPSSLPTPFS